MGHVLDEAVVAACDSIPQSLASELQVSGHRSLAATFVELVDACEECIGRDPVERHRTACSYNSKWTQAAQTALSSVLANPTLLTSQSRRADPRRSRTKVDGIPARTEHSAEFVIFALQLKLQVTARLMDDDFVKQLQNEFKNFDLRQAAIQSEIQVQVDRDVNAELRHAANHSGGREGTDGTAIELRQSFIPSGFPTQLDPGHNDDAVASAVLNARIWRKASKQSRGSASSDENQPNVSDTLSSPAGSQREMPVPLRMADRIRSLSFSEPHSTTDALDTPPLSPVSLSPIHAQPSAPTEYVISVHSLNSQGAFNASGICDGAMGTRSAQFGFAES